METLADTVRAEDGVPCQGTSSICKALCPIPRKRERRRNRNGGGKRRRDGISDETSTTTKHAQDTEPEGDAEHKGMNAFLRPSSSQPLGGEST